MKNREYNTKPTEKHGKTLKRFHQYQIATEATLTILLIAIVTLPVITAVPIYGIFEFCAISISALLLAVFGLCLTINVNKLNSREARSNDKIVSLRRWIYVVWITIPVGILATVGLSILTIDTSIQGITYAILALLWLLAVVIVVLVKSQSLWRGLSQANNSHTRLILYSVLSLCLIVLAVFGTYTTTDSIAYTSTNISDGNLEIGQSEIRQKGQAGEKYTTRNLLFGFITSTSQTKAVDEVKANGTRRYQYMYCSNGDYRYYSANQFKNPNVGFTHQSPDYCAQNGQGNQTSLADAPPAPRQVIAAPQPTIRSYPTSTHCYSFSKYSLDCYSY